MSKYTDKAINGGFWPDCGAYAPPKKRGRYRPLTFERYDPHSVTHSQLGVGQRRRRKLWLKDPHCLFCGTLFLHPDDATLEHLLPKEFGGTLAMSNLALSCRSCNGERNTFYQKFYMAKRGR